MLADGIEITDKLSSSLEPDYLLRLFFEYPPQNFEAKYLPISTAEPNFSAKIDKAEEIRGLPLFSCLFNLLITLEPTQLKRLKKWPFYRLLCRFLSYKTLFVGTTVSEFLPLPMPFSFSEAKRVAGYLQQQTRHYPFIIAKDLPSSDADLLIPRPQIQSATAFSAALQASGFIAVEGQALAYVPVDYTDIETYLTRFSKVRRKDFRRKLRALNELDIKILHKGDPSFYDDKALAEYYDLYRQVYMQSEVHFDRLSADFFRGLVQNADDSLRFITYRDKKGGLVGYNICFVIGDKLIDKYIGLNYPAATHYSLYFISWFYNLSYAQKQGLKFYIAGWTDSPVKASLGAKFIMTQHWVYIRNPLLRAILRRFRHVFEGDAAVVAPETTHREANEAVSLRAGGGKGKTSI